MRAEIGSTAGAPPPVLPPCRRAPRVQHAAELRARQSGLHLLSQPGPGLGCWWVLRRARHGPTVGRLTVALEGSLRLRAFAPRTSQPERRSLMPCWLSCNGLALDAALECARSCPCPSPRRERHAVAGPRRAGGHARQRACPRHMRLPEGARIPGEPGLLSSVPGLGTGAEAAWAWLAVCRLGRWACPLAFPCTASTVQSAAGRHAATLLAMLRRWSGMAMYAPASRRVRYWVWHPPCAAAQGDGPRWSVLALVPVSLALRPPCQCMCM